MKYWEIIVDNLSKAGWSLGWVSAIDSQGRTIWIADVHRGEKRCRVLFTADAYAPDGRRFTVLADDRLTAFVQLHAAVHSQLELR